MSEYQIDNLPRWRGFNLQEKFTHKPDEWANLAPEWGFNNEPFRESDFEIIAELGFNFVRLPLSYKCWTAENDWYALIEKPLKEIDQAVEWGKQYGIHVCLNFHRAPGYTINAVDFGEQTSLWKNDEALEACAFHWKMFAERYKNTPSEQLSFNLLNEPNNISTKDHEKVIRRLVSEIRLSDPQRLILIDACKNGDTFYPSFNLSDLNLVQCARGYDPAELTHYKASWAGGSDTWAKPEWPLIKNGVNWDKNKISEGLEPFRELNKAGNKVFVGEFGCYNQTEHQVVLRWMEDNLQLWQTENWGWALWCLRGSFGILDSNRQDVKYENYKGHKLDRRMLELLKKY